MRWVGDVVGQGGSRLSLGGPGWGGWGGTGWVSAAWVLGVGLYSYCTIAHHAHDYLSSE